MFGPRPYEGRDLLPKSNSMMLVTVHDCDPAFIPSAEYPPFVQENAHTQKMSGMRNMGPAAIPAGASIALRTSSVSGDATARYLLRGV